jgi:hypothetical protein
MFIFPHCRVYMQLLGFLDNALVWMVFAVVS